jgi:hypothetical protein
LILGFRDSYLFLGFTEPVSQPSSNSSSPHGGGLKVASELKTGSVMDILGKSDTSSTESKSSFDGIYIYIYITIKT